jgi:Mn-dependent DtxR family transcriptional regulator
MPKTLSKTREEARRLYLTGEVETNAEIATRLKVKPHTVSRWRREEEWDDLRRKIDRRAAEMFAEKIATDRVTLNVRHYRMWELLLAKMAEELKDKKAIDVRDLDRIAGILDRAQKGQRLAKGLSITGETEEAIRAQAEAEMRHLVDVFIDAVKEYVDDEDTRERIRQAILGALPAEEIEGAGEPGEAIGHGSPGAVGGTKDSSGG